MDFTSGYVLRALDQLPKQGQSQPWRLHQNYARDIRLFKHGPIDDEIDFSRGPAPAMAQADAAVEVAA
jgi:hypothetical protein